MPEPAADDGSPPTLSYETPPAEPPRGAMAAIFLVAMMDFLGFGIIIPMLPKFLPELNEHALESDPLTVLKVSLIFSIFSACQFVGAPVLGSLSDRYGRRPVLVVSQIGSALGYVMLAFAPFMGALTLLMVYLSRVLDGFTGGNVATAQAYISDVTTPKNRAKGMGMLGAAFGIGFSLGPAMGGILGHVGEALEPRWGFDEHTLSVAIPALVAAALAALAAVLSHLKLADTRTQKPSESGVWLHPKRFTAIAANPVVVQMLLISFFIMAAFVMMEATLVIFVSSTKHFGFSTLQTGLYFGWLGLCIIIVQGGLIGRLTKRLGEWPLAIAGPAFVAAGMFLFVGTGWWASVALLLLAGAVNAIGRSLQQPAMTSLMSQYSDRHVQGTVFGVYHGLGSLARVVGPLAAPLTYPLLRNTGQFVTAGVIATLVAVWTLLLMRQAGRPGSPPKAEPSEP